MMKYKCAIIEDEHHNQNLLQSYVSQMNKIELLGTFSSPVDFLNFDRIDEIAIIFLDIHLPGMTGIEFLKSKVTNAEVIITTAYSDYALDGYELDVVHYLLKPIELHQFIKATQKAIEQIKLKATKLENKKTPLKSVILKVDKKLVKVLITDIIYIKADWNYVQVYTPNAKLMVLSTMKVMEEVLPNSFMRIHKSFLINLEHFKSLEGNTIQLTDNTQLHVSRNYKPQLLTRLSLV